MPENYRIDHYYSLEAGGEIEEGHIFCTPEEGRLIEDVLVALPGVEAIVEPAGEYDYTTEGSDALSIAADIVANSGFHIPEEN